MTVSFCIVSLGVIIISSWYSFLWQLATNSERRRRIEAKLLSEQCSDYPFDNEPENSDAA